ncbi:MAG: hypothetical protein EA404_14420 [Spirochaetaceae bacterium]|nr:MAG: hypothetical protein EA404_14420 [Spirochaetaceae bacterium]
MWVLLISGLWCLLPVVAAAQEADSSAPRVEGWSVGVSIDTVRDDTVVGGRIGYWSRVFGFDARAQFGFHGLDDAKTNATIEQRVGAVVAIGAKGGFQVGRAKWYGRLGVGFQGEERRMGPEDDEKFTVALGSGEAGAGVDLAATDRLILGLTLVTVRVQLGEFNVPQQEPTELFGGQISLLSGAHISVQL